MGRYIAFFSGIATLPPIFSHSPFGTYFHSFGSLSVLAWPAQEWSLVPQSFLPASATPAHFSLAASAAVAAVLPRASTLATADAMAMLFRFMRFLRNCLIWDSANYQTRGAKILLRAFRNWTRILLVVAHPGNVCRSATAFCPQSGTI